MIVTSCSTPLLPLNRILTLRPSSLDLAAEQRRRAEALVLLGIFPVADAQILVVEQADDGGDDLVLAERAFACRSLSTLRRIFGSALPNSARPANLLASAWPGSPGGSDIACGRDHRCRSPGDGHWDPCRTRRPYRPGASAIAFSRSIVVAVGDSLVCHRNRPSSGPALARVAGSLSLLCLNTACYASLDSSTGISERRAGGFLSAWRIPMPRSPIPES